MKKLVLFFLFFLLGLQIPQCVENYRISTSAVVMELQGDYDRLAGLASEYRLTVPEFLAAAQKTDNVYAQRAMAIAAEKVPRYLALKAQLDVLESGEIFRMVKIVFFSPDPAIWKNVVRTFKPGLYLNLDGAWYVFIGSVSALLVMLLSGLWSLIFGRRRRQQQAAAAADLRHF